jgi:hypothetical protein
MPIRRGTKRIIMVAVAIPLILLGILAVGMNIDDVCSPAEQRAIAEPLNPDGPDLQWESNVKVTGGCTTSYIVNGAPGEVRASYRDLLHRNGWSVTVGPAYSFPLHLATEHDGLTYFLMFEDAGRDSIFEGVGHAPHATDRSPEESAALGEKLRAAEQDEECPTCASAVEPGQTRVTILGGHPAATGAERPLHLAIPNVTGPRRRAKGGIAPP